MKVFAFVIQALLFSFAPVLGKEECTHGKLYVTDNSTSQIHVFDVSGGKLDSLSVETTVTLPSVGAGQLAYYGAPVNPLVVQYRGTEEQGYQDGFVRFIDTGLRVENHGNHYDVSYTAPSIISNANIDDCARPIHQVHNDDKIAIFCDGAFDHVPQINTTIHVVDETKLGSTSESAVVYSIVLEGTHHGVAVPVDDGHLLHSIPLPERVARVEEASSLPSTFQVVDYGGNVLHELSDTSNPDLHCAGFHGSATQSDNALLLACDAVHGGILRVKYDPQTGEYASQALTYPQEEKYDSFRVGSFAYHKNSEYTVGSFTLRGGTEFHLAAISPTATALEETNVLTLPDNARQCGYQFEVGTGKHLLVFMPTGVLHVFQIEHGSFQKVAEQEIVPNMSACSEAVFVAGVGQAFVATPADKTLYAVALSHVEDGEIEVFSSTLPFFPTGMTVSGFSHEAVCQDSHEHEDSNGNNDSTEQDEYHEKEEPASGANLASMIGALAVTANVLFL